MKFLVTFPIFRLGKIFFISLSHQSLPPSCHDMVSSSSMYVFGYIDYQRRYDSISKITFLIVSKKHLRRHNSYHEKSRPSAGRLFRSFKRAVTILQFYHGRMLHGYVFYPLLHIVLRCALLTHAVRQADLKSWKTHFRLVSRTQKF